MCVGGCSVGIRGNAEEGQRSMRQLRDPYAGPLLFNNSASFTGVHKEGDEVPSAQEGK